MVLQNLLEHKLGLKTKGVVEAMDIRTGQPCNGRQPSECMKGESFVMGGIDGVRSIVS